MSRKRQPYPRVHAGIPFTNWKPHEDAAILAAKPVPESQRRHVIESPLQRVAVKLGRSYDAVRTRRYRLLRGRADASA